MRLYGGDEVYVVFVCVFFFKLTLFNVVTL